MVRVLFCVVVDAGKALGFHLEAGFLAHLSKRRLDDRFARLACAARKFPVQASVGMADEQDMSSFVRDDSRCTDSASRPSQLTMTFTH